jgi:hypothetical protein
MATSSRLTLRQLQERKQLAEMAIRECMQSIQGWEMRRRRREMEGLQGEEPERWAEFNAEILQKVALIKAAFPNERVKVGTTRGRLF